MGKERPGIGRLYHISIVITCFLGGLVYNLNTSGRWIAQVDCVNVIRLCDPTLGVERAMTIA